jgi:hypothetical protein
MVIVHHYPYISQVVQVVLHHIVRKEREEMVVMVLTDVEAVEAVELTRETEVMVEKVVTD